MNEKRKHTNDEISTEVPKPKILKKSSDGVRSTTGIKKNQKQIKGDGGNKVKGKKFDRVKGKSKPVGLENKPDIKTDWKKLKLEKKELRAKRRQQRPHYGISVEMKRLYETLKCKSSSNKDELVKKLYTLLKTNAKSFVMAHDTARIVQCVLKHANLSTKKDLSEELLPISVDMATSKYAHFCILRIIKYGDKTTRSKFIESFYGNVCKLTMHQISNSIIDLIYTTHASELQKNMMKQEFYGDIYKNIKDSTITTLSDTYKDSPQLKSAILSAVKGNLEQVANKNVVDNALVHTVLYEYLMECQSEDFQELMNVYSSKIPLLLTTRDGCRAATQLFWKAVTKDRRAMVKSIKEHILKIATHEQGYTFLIVVSNCMDDTKSIKKNIFDLLLPNLKEVVQCECGRKVIEWLVSPGCKVSFNPKLIEFFDEGLQYSKKPSDIRRKEILEQIEEPLSKEICEDPSFWMSNGHIALLTGTILKKLSEKNFSVAAESIAKIVTGSDWICTPSKQKTKNNQKDIIMEKVNNENVSTENCNSCLGIEDSGLHIALKRIIKNDGLRISSNENTVGEFIVHNLTADTINSWIKINRACFILLEIFKNSKDETKMKLKSFFTERCITDLKDQEHVGAKLLLEEITN